MNETIAPYGHSLICLDAPITDESDAQSWREHADFVSSTTEQKDVIIIVPFTDLDAATTFSEFDAVKTSYRFIAVCCPGLHGLEPQLAASIAGVISAEADPALPFNGVRLKALPALGDDSKLTRQGVEQALQKGVSIIQPDAAGYPAIVRLITTYRVSGTGGDDDLMLDANKPLILRYLRQVTRETIERNPRRKDTEAQRKQVLSEVFAAHVKLEDAEILNNVRALFDKYHIESSKTERGRVRLDVPAELIDGMHVVNAVLHIY